MKGGRGARQPGFWWCLVGCWLGGVKGWSGERFDVLGRRRQWTVFLYVNQLLIELRLSYGLEKGGCYIYEAIYPAQEPNRFS